MLYRVLMGVDNGLPQMLIRFDGISFELSLKEISRAVVAQVKILGIRVEKVAEMIGGVGGFGLDVGDAKGSGDAIRSFGR